MGAHHGRADRARGATVNGRQFAAACCWAVVGASLTTATMLCFIVTAAGHVMYRGIVSANALALVRENAKKAEDDWWG